MYFDPYNPFVLVPYHHDLDLGMWRRMITLAGWPGAACLSLVAAWPSLVAARAWVGIDQCTQDQRPLGLRRIGPPWRTGGHHFFGRRGIHGRRSEERKMDRRRRLSASRENERKRDVGGR